MALLPRRRSPRPATTAGAVALAVAAVGLTACGPGDARVALAIHDARWTGPDTVTVTVECSTDVSASVAPAAGTDGLPLVTIGGHPVDGRCWTPVPLVLPPGTTRVDDATTGMVVVLPPRP